MKPEGEPKMSVPCMLIITTRTSGLNTNTTSNANAGTSMTAPVRRFFATRTFAVRPPCVLAPCGDCDEWVDDAISRFLSFSGSGIALPRAMGNTLLRLLVVSRSRSDGGRGVSSC